MPAPGKGTELVSPGSAVPAASWPSSSPHPRLDLGLSSFGTQPRPPLGPLGPALVSPHQLPSRCDLVKPPPYSRHFQTCSASFFK